MCTGAGIQCHLTATSAVDSARPNLQRHGENRIRLPLRPLKINSIRRLHARSKSIFYAALKRRPALAWHAHTGPCKPRRMSSRRSGGTDRRTLNARFPEETARRQSTADDFEDGEMRSSTASGRE